MSQRLAEVLPYLKAEMQRINRLLADGDRHEAIAQFHALANVVLRTQRTDLVAQGHVLPARTVEISVCRIPAVPRVDKPIALFLPGLMSFLPLAVARAATLADLFDLVVCELPGHGASGQPVEVSLDGFADEFAAVLETALRNAAEVFLIGESLGGLLALKLARRLPDKVRNVLLIDPPFVLTRPDLARWIALAWRDSGSRPYIRQICSEIMGFDPADGRVLCTTPHHDLARGAGFNCLLIAGGDALASGAASAVSEDDMATLRAMNPRLLVASRIPYSGHAVLLDNPDGTLSAVKAFLQQRVSPG